MVKVLKSKIFIFFEMIMHLVILWLKLFSTLIHAIVKLKTVKHIHFAIHYYYGVSDSLNCILTLSFLFYSTTKQLIQFWHYLPRDSVRLNWLRAHSYTRLNPHPSTTYIGYQSQVQVVTYASDWLAINWRFLGYCLLGFN